MATNLTNFFERGSDVADVYIGKDEVLELVLNNNFDLDKLSEVGFKEITCNTIWGTGWNLSLVLGQPTGSGIFDSRQYSSPIVAVENNCVWSYVSAGCNHSSAIKTDGSLWSWGNNTLGKLGIGNTDTTRTPIQEVSSSTWSVVSNGGLFTSGLKTDGTIWSWGSNSCGTLGINIDPSSFSNTCSPVQEATLSTWCNLSAGRFHTVGIKNDNTLWGWGEGKAFGSNTIVCQSSPTQEVSLSSWSKLAAGCGNTIAIKTNGTIWGSGANFYGNLGNGLTAETSSFVQEVSNSTDWCAVGVSTFSSHAIKTGGTLWSWGYNNRGQLADCTVLDKCSPVQEISQSTNWDKMSTGGHSSQQVSAIKKDGTLWSWGSNDAGVLGNNTSFVCDRSSPVQEIKNIDTWKHVSRGFCYTLALKG